MCEQHTKKLGKREYGETKYKFKDRRQKETNCDNGKREDGDREKKKGEEREVKLGEVNWRV